MTFGFGQRYAVRVAISHSNVHCAAVCEGAYDSAYAMVPRRTAVALVRALVAFILVASFALSFAAPASAMAAEGSEGNQAAETAPDASEQGALANVLTDGESASIEGVRFGLVGFSRAEVGTNTPVDGQYRGYRYFTAAEPGELVVIDASEYCVAYVSDRVAETVGFDINNTDDQAAFKAMMVALDTKANKGGSSLNAASEWHFTNETSYTVGGVQFLFDEQVKENQYYACVIGEDGSDVTSADNPSHIKLTHATLAEFAPVDAVSVQEEATGWQAFVEFLQRVDLSPLWVTLKTTLTAIVFIFVLGLAAAYFSLRIPSRAQDLADSIFTIPMVLPPTVCGFLLLLAFGRNTALGQWFIDIGFPLVFSWPATVIAAVVVAFPLMYRNARGAFESIDANMLDAARTLGWSNARIFFKLMLPLSWSSIAAGTVLSFARALGEFGATMFLAGNYLGVTRTIPIAIYFEWMNGNTDVAIFWTVIIMIFSFVVILFINLWSRHTTKYRRRVEE
ncbi:MULTISPECIES: molybdate ABC transporter permease subunit [unclassified Adlercreutzia]|uniref:molybdate ABC transporter permease subunit n=1 Tax=unclassified Adlercreutzia TaxID=2636013 RepID=UPI001F1552CA|nr:MULTISPECIES: molybdate ABC transporter permease subunit [unclassified Adlercreutzia]